jgi:hypothetical protein
VSNQAVEGSCRYSGGMVARLQLILLDLLFHRVTFLAWQPDEPDRLIRVEIGSRTRSHRAVRFPNLGTEGGESLGDEALDEHVRRRATEELVRLRAAVEAMCGGQLAA